MTELKDWPPSLIMAAVGLVMAAIALPVAIGYLLGPGWGWLFLAVQSLVMAKQMHEIYREERKKMKGQSE